MDLEGAKGIILVVGGPLFILYGVFPYLISRKFKKFERIKNEVFSGSDILIQKGNKVFGIAFGVILEGRYRGRQVTITDFDGSKNSPARTDIYLHCSVPVDLKLTLEGKLSSIGKSFGVLKEVEINDPAFDGRFVIKSSEPSTAQGLLMKDDVREKCLAISQDKSFNYIECERGQAGNPARVHLQLSGNSARLIENPSRARNLIETFFELAERLER